MKFVIGDIHGEISKLKLLIKFICKNDNFPEFIFIGDYIDKGENSKKTLDHLDELRKNYKCVFLIGNHEYLWKNATKNKNYLFKYGGISTINSFGFKSIEQTQNYILRNYENLFNMFVDYYLTDSYLIVHSGIQPEYYLIDDINKIPTESYLFNRYSFLQVERYFQDKYKIIFGHTAFFKPYKDSYKIGIDTAACYIKSQPLTAFCIEENMFYNSHNKKYLIESLPENSCANIVRNKPTLNL
jgi:serine/threonine protein phosphatase 1